jgi:hypothetical protein
MFFHQVLIRSLQFLPSTTHILYPVFYLLPSSLLHTFILYHSLSLSHTQTTNSVSSWSQCSWCWLFTLKFPFSDRRSLNPHSTSTVTKLLSSLALLLSVGGRFRVDSCRAWRSPWLTFRTEKYLWSGRPNPYSAEVTQWKDANSWVRHISDSENDFITLIKLFTNFFSAVYPFFSVCSLFYASGRWVVFDGLKPSKQF